MKIKYNYTVKKDEFFQKAQANKVKLFSEIKEPISLVNIKPSNNSYQGWEVQPAGKVSDLPYRRLKKGG